MDNIAIENFINFCDEMQIANEGIFNNIGTGIMNIIKWILQKIKIIGNRIRAAVRALLGKDDTTQLKQENQRLQMENDLLKRKLDKTGKVLNDVKRSKDLKIGELRQVISNLEALNVSLKNKIQELPDKYRKEYESKLDSKMNHIKNDYESIIAEIKDKYEGLIEDNSSRISDLTNALNDANHKLKSSNDTYEVLDMNYKNEISKHEFDNKRYKTEIDKHKSVINEYKSKIDKLANECEDLKRTMTGMTDDLSQKYDKASKVINKMRDYCRVPSSKAVTEYFTFYNQYMVPLIKDTSIALSDTFKGKDFTMDDNAKATKALDNVKLKFERIKDSTTKIKNDTFFNVTIFDSDGLYDDSNDTFFPKKALTNQFRVMDAGLNNLKGSMDAYTKINANRVEDPTITRILTFTSSVIAFDELVIDFLRSECCVDIYNLDNKDENKKYNDIRKPVIDDPEKIARIEMLERRRVESVDNSVDRPRRRRLM